MAIDLGESAGIYLDESQQYCLLNGCAENAQHRWAAFETVIEQPRQNGKGEILLVRQLAGLFLFNESLQIHTAHEFKTARKHFQRIRNVIEGTPSLMKRVKAIYTGAGQESIVLKNGCQLDFVARSGGSGRGFTGDTLYLDEAFKLSIDALGALLFALSAVPNPQIWYASSAPHADSEQLHALLKRAEEPDPGRLFLASWSNVPGTDPDDREAWARANPALGVRITEETIENELRTARAKAMAEFERERLGIAESPDGGALIFGPGAWAACADTEARAVGAWRLSLDVHPELHWASFGGAATRADGTTDVVVFDRRRGTSWVVEYAKSLTDRFNVPLNVLARSQAGALVDALEAADVKVVEVTNADYADSCGAFRGAVQDQGVWHQEQPHLDAAVSGCQSIAVGKEGAFVWARLSSQADISPLVAVTLAFGAGAVVKAPAVELVVL